MEEHQQIALLPPIALQEMRVAWDGHLGETPGERQAVKWLSEDPKGFRVAKAKLESDYLLTQSKAVPVKVEGDSSVPVGSGSARCIAVAEEWLAKNGVKR